MDLNNKAKQTYYFLYTVVCLILSASLFTFGVFLSIIRFMMMIPLYILYGAVGLLVISIIMTGLSKLF